MPRRKLSEFRSKIILTSLFESEYIGWSVSSGKDLEGVVGFESYTVKVDQAVKGRFKKGLVLLDVKQEGLINATRTLFAKGYSSLIVEPYVLHEEVDEQYFAMSQERSQITIRHSSRGGVDIENHEKSVETFNANDITELSKVTGFTKNQLKSLVKIFKANHMVFLEINPYIYKDNSLVLLDAAIEVDDAGRHYSQLWTEQDMRREKVDKISTEDTFVDELNASSASSFSLTTLNADGSFFLLLSGGGASVVVADEIYNKGLGEEIANYGEYSGNPTTDETYLYALQILKLLINSKSSHKYLFIGGAVANFTDISVTFEGIIHALDEYRDQLADESLTVFVRRGGPNQALGLENMKAALLRYNLNGHVYDSSTPLNEAVSYMIEDFKNVKY